MLKVITECEKYYVVCGSGKIQLPVMQHTDESAGFVVSKIINESGFQSLFRKAVEVKYIPRVDVNNEKVYTPIAKSYDSIETLIPRLAELYCPYEISRISRMTDKELASLALEKVVMLIINRLAKSVELKDSETSFEVLANSQQAVVLETPLPNIAGRFTAEIEAHRRLEAAKHLMKTGALSSPNATICGSPGKSYYLTDGSGYTITEKRNPLRYEMPEKRRGVINAVKNAVNITGKENSLVEMSDVNVTPPMTNAVVVCMPISGNDSVIISESLAQKLTAVKRESNFHGINGVINFRGGYRMKERNGRLVKTQSEWPLCMKRNMDIDGNISYSRDEVIKPAEYANMDAMLLKKLRSEYETKYSGMIAGVGSYTSAEMSCWKKWLSRQTRWTGRLRKRTLYTKFSSVERINLQDNVMYREDLGTRYIPAEAGMKIQSDGDLLKGVVSSIMPDDKMPYIKLAGRLIRTEVVCEMNQSTAKHGSLRFAHGQIALYAIAAEVGGLGLVGTPGVEEIAELGVETGVYEDDFLCCDVMDNTGTVSLGKFPAGVIRICRHRQDPSVVSGAKGGSYESEQDSVKSGGCVNGLPDTFCMMAAGLDECVKELRSNIPTRISHNIELLRNCLS